MQSSKNSYSRPQLANDWGRSYCMKETTQGNIDENNNANEIENKREI